MFCLALTLTRQLIDCMSHGNGGKWAEAGSTPTNCTLGIFYRTIIIMVVKVIPIHLVPRNIFD